MGSLGKLISEKGWTLFLDRDGVINTRLPADYVKAEQFELNPGVLEAMEILSGLFSHVFVVTNQQGIGRGLMTNQDLNRVHEHMISMVNKAVGKIDKVYYSRI